MTQSALQSVVDNAHMQPSPADVASHHLSLKHASSLTGGFLSEFFKDIDQAGTTRTELLMDKLLGTTVEERDRALKEFKQSNKIIGAKGKEVIDPVASVRASEIKTIWAGLNIVGMTPKDWLEFGGYHRIVQAVRQELTTRKIDVDGDVKKPAEERKQDKVKACKASAMTDVMLANPHQEGESDVDYLMRITGLMTDAGNKAAEEQAIERGNTIAAKLIEKEDKLTLARIVHALNDFLSK